MLLRLLKDRHLWIMLACDCLLVTGAYYLAFWLRFDGYIPPAHLHLFKTTLWWILPLKLAFFWVFGMYKGMWRFFGIHDVLNIAKACGTAFAVTVIVILAVDRFSGYPRSVFFLDLILCLMLVGGFRLMVRMWYAPLSSGSFFKRKAPAMARVLIIGAGSGGEKLLREIRDNRDLNYDVVGFIDDKVTKYHKMMHGVPVLGPIRDMARIAEKHRVEELIIAIPSAGGDRMREIVRACKQTGIPFKTMPGLGDLINGRVSVAGIREVRFEDLLGREPVHMENEIIGDYITGKAVLVTGAAGSIGSELCRQIARFDPSRLIMVERSESGLYDHELQLKSEFPGLVTVPVLGTIQNKTRMDAVFEHWKPRVVFHAAAYKHVPMLEAHPHEAIFNNIVGSRVIMELCHEHGLDRCVIVSTDKAVRPTNVMGATKRVTELLAQCFAGKNGVRYMAVRFGNVVGSAGTGSVIPLFMKQIARGGPVTVTHPEVTRYFMTIPEASSLILQAGAFGEGGELFVLKMGTPIRIQDMARDLITLNGLKPGKDISIEFTGLRPGEKLYEELITHDENIQKTRHKDIMVLKPLECSAFESMTAQIEALVERAHAMDGDGIRKKLQEIVPEYHPADGGAQQPGPAPISNLESRTLNLEP